ncbi:hypothetical protein E0Z10_g8211 [Xylaria hypoxylon]|uniref:Nudix hydrolase domain-containing protein n=1 Tax=Xylaria hypoxylon TaxID=37992 RepID=A0A4Z0YPR7_9PEZI|nr:hypothetical protein E0Z10_g8211 [Xylaria hypoxylon]
MARNIPERTPIAVGKRRVRSKIAENGKELRKREIWVRDNAVNWKDERVWAKIRNQGCYHKSDEIIVSCGTVTINKAEGPCPKVLVVYNNRIGIFQLPKGRKDIGEGYLDAAIRETTEETGIAVRPLRLRFGSRSTPPRLATAAGVTACGSEDPSTGVTRSLSNEMIGVNPDPATGAWRNIHWYAAKPCDGVERDESCMPIPDDRDKFSTYWFSELDALSRLKLDDEKFSKSSRKTVLGPPGSPTSKSHWSTRLCTGYSTISRDGTIWKLTVLARNANLPANFTIDVVVRVAFDYTRNMSTDDWSSNEELEGK